MTSTDPSSSCPTARLLSNGSFSTLLTDAGTGYSRLGETALSRWSGDRVEDGAGYFLYLRDMADGQFWSLGAQPASAEDARYDAGSERGWCWLECANHGIAARLDLTVSPDCDLEVRRVTVRNTSGRTRRIELTSYLEVVLNAQAAEASHPAFSKLFVQTESVAAGDALLARRRPRGADEAGLWMAHAALGGSSAGFETDRKRFLGRGADLAAPDALTSNQPLSGTAGNVLDPVFSLRRTVELAPGESAEVVFLLGAHAERAAALELISGVLTGPAVDAIFAHSAEVEAQLCAQLGISGERASYFQALAGAMLYGDADLRAEPGLLARAGSGVDGVLRRYGLPDSAMLCVIRARAANDPYVAEWRAAQRYWSAKGLDATILVLDAAAGAHAETASVFARRPNDIEANHLDAILAMAHLVTEGELPALRRAPIAAKSTPRPAAASTAVPLAGPLEPLRFFNGNGGFSADGTEYIIRLQQDATGRLQRPPLPWINTIANEQIGFLVSESGAGCTWSRNSRAHRLTPWHNDPVCDPHGEALYIRDEESGAFWSPTPGPVCSGAGYEAAHGFGYTRFRHASHGLEQETTMFVARHDPLKIVRIRLTNHGSAARTLSLFSYQQLVLGGTPAEHSRFVVTEHDAGSGALLAVNRFAGEFADGVTFAAAIGADAHACHHSGNRASFIGRNGSPARPAALAQTTLDGRTGAGLDPCAAFQQVLTLAAGGSAEFAFLLGETVERGAALQLVARYREPGAVARAFDQVRAFWRETVTAIQVQTPVSAIDVMLNGWLAYQNLGCRIWGRSAFYQSGGAFGFRDQLQDSSALIYARPDLTRAQIRLHAAHQFVEGDVLHWWHPAPLEQGLRTRFADDLLWLPYITAFYVRTTGDWKVLDEIEPFLTAPLLEEGEDEVFLRPQFAGTSADVYEHCCRALDRSLTKGARGLPLMGTGDWNDGMNRVGREGRGESVWMGFFLYSIIADFLPICERREDTARIASYRAYRKHLQVALNDSGWDGEWYRRAYYDSGAALGSKDGDECQIDALAQAWAIMSRAAPAERAAEAMDAVERRLISEQDGLIRLLTPAFVDTPHDPGYIKGYVAGVRENGGQYTHAACWVVRAMAEMGRHDRAARLLELLSPVSHALTPEAVAVYQVEPYVIAADIYGEAPHVGRGGWTWYTGSAGWMYRVALESVLGFTLEGGDTIVLKPCVPHDWPEFSIDYRVPGGATHYQLRIRNPERVAGAVRSASMDGAPVPVEQGAARIPLVDDGGRHQVDIVIG